jgi:hypothetical protein
LLKSHIPRRDIPNFIDALVKDNLDNPRWHKWQGDVSLTAWVSRDPENREFRRDSIQLHIYSDDDALNWLRENGYLG